jgi:hypothetical protein
LDSLDSYPFTVIAADISAWSGRPSLLQLELRAGLTEVLEEACRAAAMDRERWRRQDKGDEELALVPADVPVARVVADLTREFDTAPPESGGQGKQQSDDGAPAGQSTSPEPPKESIAADDPSAEEELSWIQDEERACRAREEQQAGKRARSSISGESIFGSIRVESDLIFRQAAHSKAVWGCRGCGSRSGWRRS